MPVLDFKGKVAVESYHHTVPHHVLDLDAKLSLLGKGEKPSLAGNLIIEGDNLVALKALLPTHAGQVKCIYIDPPYNTGKEVWVYNDNLTQPQFKEWIGKVVGTEAEDACRHDKWCCMMYPRLQLLHELLRDDGVIWISIDDNEIHHLLMLMDELFGRQNFIGTAIWKGATDNNPTLIAIEHEYIVCWAKERGKLPAVWSDPNPGAKDRMLSAWEDIRKGTRDLAEVQKQFRSFIREHRAECEPLTHYDRIDEEGPFTGSRKVHNPGREGYRYDVIHPVTKKSCKVPARGYRFPPHRMEDLLKSGKVLFGEDEDQIIQIKEYLRDYEGSLKSVIEFDSRTGANSLEAIFGNRETFSGPKPVRLLRTLFGFCTTGDDIILDSFAGSGTTGEAALSLNAEDGTARRFILIQQPHDSVDDKEDQRNICQEITAERVRRVSQGYSKVRSRGKEAVEGLGGSFTYARIGKPLLGEHRDWGEKLPAWLDLGRYVFFTETSHELDAKECSEKTGYLGEHGGTSYYLLYSTELKTARALDHAFLDVLRKDRRKRKVVYCEKVWVYREDLAHLRSEIGDVRPMLLPFQVK